MQRRIEALAAGNCGRQSTLLQFTPEKIEFEILEGTVYTGEFTIESSGNIPVTGKVCSTSPRMKCLQAEFAGTAVTQKFEFHSEGLSDRDSQKGEFHIISDQGEYTLPFSVSVCKDYPDSSQGKIKSIIEFVNLARVSYDEAVKVFSQPEFEAVFTAREREEQLMFRALRRRPCTRAQVEEFLIASGKKRRVLFWVEEAKQEFRGLTQTRKEYIVLRKEEWGHFALEVSAEGEFLKPLKTRITDEDFVGSRGMVEYLIDADKIHNGKNYGSLTLKTPFQKEEITICVTKEAIVREHPMWEIRKKQIELAEDYLKFGLHKMAAGVWAKKTLKTLEQMQRLVPGDLWYLLAKAQVYLVNQQRQEAEWTLNSFPRNKVDKESPLYAYYLYLCSLREPEPGYVNRCTAKIRKIFNKNQENPVLLWILLFLDEDLNYSKGKKLDTITRYIRRGNESVLLYVEAFRILEKEPYLLSRISDIEQKILNFIVKHQAMTKGIAERVVKMLPEIPIYKPVWYRILAACHKVTPDRETLQAICSYCIKGQCYGKEYWQWYHMGVMEELRITGLHEAWLRSAGREQMAKLPKQIVLYFQSYSNYGGETEALLYEAVIENKSQWKNAWPHYSKNIREFALKQLQSGRIDRTLAVVYQEALTPELLTPERAKDMAKALFACEVQCDNPNVRNLVVCQYSLAGEQIVPIVHGKAYVGIYGSSFQFLLEDAAGRRFVPEQGLLITQLLDNERFLKQGMSCASGQLPYVLKYFDKKRIWQTFKEEDLEYLQMMVNSPEISEAYRQELRPQMVAYYYDNYTGETLDAFLLSLSFEGIGNREREKIMRLLVARRHYQRVYELLQNYGIEYITPSKLVYVICYRMDELEQEEQEGVDAFLLELCREVFLKGKYNERILLYLCKYFEGSLSEMLKLWESVQGFELDTYEIEERCLRRFLYTGDFSARMEDVFESYVRNMGKDLVILAYLSQMAHQYMVGDAVIAETVFQKIAGMLGQGQKLNRVCRLAFLKWCALKPEISKEEWNYARPVMEELIREECCFAFFQSFSRKIQEKYMLHDRIVVEYRTTPQAKVYINYLPVGYTKYVEREMKQMYDGIFAKEFVIFFDENIPYYIKEEIDGEYKVMESGQIVRQSLADSGEESRPVLIDDIMAAWQMKDEAALVKWLETYGRLDVIVKEEFTLL